MKILIVSVAALLLAGTVYYLIAHDRGSTEQAIVSTQAAANKDAEIGAQAALTKNIIFRQPSADEPDYPAAKTALAKKLLQIKNPPRARMLTTDRILVAELFRASDAITKNNFGLGKSFDVTLFEDQPCSFASLQHPMTKAGTFWVLMARCQERLHKTSVRMILSPQNNQLYVSISDQGIPQAKSLHLTGDYVMALDEVKNPD